METSALDTADTEALDAICEYLGTHVAGAANVKIGADTPLLEGDLIDSLGILQLTAFLEEKLGVTVGDEDFVPENFETIGSLARFVQVRKAG